MKKHGIFAALAGVAMGGTLFAADRTIDADYTLTGDETVDGVLSISEGVTLDLAGHKLTVSIASGKSWHIRNTTFENGRIETGTTGWLHVVDATDASTVDFKVNSAMQIDAQFDVGGYEPVWSGAETCGGQSPSKSFYKKEQRHDDTKSTLR